MSILKELGIGDHRKRVNEELVYNIASCYALIEAKMMKALEPFGLSPVKMNAMLILKHVDQGRGMPQSELSKRMVVTAGNITRLLDRLQKDSLITRSELSGDRRVNIIKITKKGSDLLDRAWPHYIHSIEKIAKAGEKGLDGVVQYLNTFRKNLQLLS